MLEAIKWLILGTYHLEKETIVNIEKLTEQDNPIQSKFILTIDPHGNITWGGGIIHELKLKRELDNGYADFLEDYTIENKRNMIVYTLRITREYFILYAYPYHGKLIKHYFSRKNKEL